MNKKRIKSIALAALVCAASVYNIETISATSSSTGSTSATVTFTENTGPTKPVDPEEPENPDEEKPPVDGSLAIVWVTPAFNFGSGKVSAQKQNLDLVIDPLDLPNIQIVDLRGSNTGWRLDAKLSDFKDEGDAVSLLGSLINILEGNLNSTTSMSFAPTAETGVNLAAGGTEKRILYAPAGRGQGLWVDRFYSSPDKNSLLNLEVPAGSATIGSHNATITWTLYNAP